MKKVAIASILVLNPKILLLDEPSSELPASDIDVIIEIIGEYKRKNHSVIIASHDVEFVSEVADRIYLIKNGTILAEGTKRILGDADLLKQIGFKPPIAVQVYRQLITRENSIPITLNDLAMFLREYCLKNSERSKPY